MIERGRRRSTHCESADGNSLVWEVLIRLLVLVLKLRRALDCVREMKEDMACFIRTETTPTAISMSSTGVDVPVITVIAGSCLIPRPLRSCWRRKFMSIMILDKSEGGCSAMVKVVKERWMV